MTEAGFRPANAPRVESGRFIEFKDHKGFSRAIEVKTTEAQLDDWLVNLLCRIRCSACARSWPRCVAVASCPCSRDRLRRSSSREISCETCD